MGFEYNFLISTRSSIAQDEFNKGMIEMHGFNHEHAIRHFERALEADPTLGIINWAISHCYGINYNNPDGLDRVKAYKYYIKATELIQNGNEIEKLLIKALSKRFPTPIIEQPQEEKNTKLKIHKEILENEIEFSKELKKIFEKHPDHVEIISIYAESMMNHRPWKLWVKNEQGNIEEETYLIQNILENGLKKFPKHPGLLHFYIHLMELSPNPEKALFAANSLKTLISYQGHLLHMPSHIYMWLGDYEQSIVCNFNAIKADQDYVIQTGIQSEFYKLYRLHNIHFCCWACMFDGQYENSLQLARSIQAELTLELLFANPGIYYQEALYSIIWHVFIRFGKWNEILSEPIPDDKSIYPASISTAYYARGIAYASLGDIKNAEIEKENFFDSLQNPELSSRSILNNYVYKKSKGILHIAISMLKGEIEYRKGNFNDAFIHLRNAVDLNSKLVYSEPWGWMVPPRHALGALLFEQGHFNEAMNVYKDDLSNYTDNLWSLGGLIKCLEKMDDVDPNYLKQLNEKLQFISKRADINVKASCFCAVAAGAAEINSCKSCEN